MKILLDRSQKYKKASQLGGFLLQVFLKL